MGLLANCAACFRCGAARWGFVAAWWRCRWASACLYPSSWTGQRRCSSCSSPSSWRWDCGWVGGQRNKQGRKKSQAKTKKILKKSIRDKKNLSIFTGLFITCNQENTTFWACSEQAHIPAKVPIWEEKNLHCHMCISACIFFFVFCSRTLECYGPPGSSGAQQTRLTPVGCSSWAERDHQVWLRLSLIKVLCRTMNENIWLCACVWAFFLVLASSLKSVYLLSGFCVKAFRGGDPQSQIITFWVHAGCVCGYLSYFHISSGSMIRPYTDGTQIQDAGGVVAITSYG